MLRKFVAAGALALAPLVLGLVAPASAAPQRDDIIGEVQTHTAVWEDMFVDIARRYDVGYVHLRAANPDVHPWVPGVGTRVTIPSAHILPDAARKGIVINIPELRMYYFSSSGVRSYPLGIGRDGAETPRGSTTVVRKTVNPTWYPPASIRKEKPYLPAVVPPGPDNPLGAHALYLGWKSYLIHGTNLPDGVGRRTSHGCIRMYPEDVAELYRMAGPGTPVTVVNQPVKVGWRGGDLYLEVHPTPDQADEIEMRDPVTPVSHPGLEDKVRKAAGADADRVDWDLVAQVAAEHRGVPVRVTRPVEMAEMTE